MKLIYLVLSIFFAMSCTYEMASNPHESHALKKSLFDGEWFLRATLVSKHSHSSFSFTGMECPVERVRFEITKDKLLAYRSYDKGTPQKEDSRNQNLVAAFNIIEHFDTSRRPWHERDSILVDWSENLAPHLECNQWLQDITATNIDNTDVVDRTEPFRIRIEKDYMESTVDALVKPDVTTCANIGDWSCHSAEYRVKFSFKKIDQSNDYEKRHYPDAEPIRFGTNEKGLCLENDKDCKDIKELWLYSDARRTVLCDPLKHNIKDCFAPTVTFNNRFGFFRTEIEAYEREKGFTRRGREQLINRWNLWEQSRSKDGGVIPIEKRQPKKIVYYLNPGFPRDLLPSIKRVEKEWNTAFAHVIAKIKDRCTLKGLYEFVQKHDLSDDLKVSGIEKIDATNLKESCAIIYRATKDKSEIFFTGDSSEIDSAFGQIFEIRENDCNRSAIEAFAEKNNLGSLLVEQGIIQIDDDNIERACAVLEWASHHYGISEQFTWQQIGDLRYSFVNAVIKPDGELLGYGPSGVDPKTGEIISANANIYLSSITHYANRSAMLLGFLEKMNFTALESNEEQANDDDTVADFSAYVNQVISSMTESSYKAKRVNSYQTTNFIETAQLNIFNSFGKWPHEEMEARLRDITIGKRDIDNLLSMIAGNTSIGTHAFLRNNVRDEFFSERSACFSQGLNEPPYARMNKKLQGMSFLEKVDYIKSQVFEAVLKHELGHTFGLRHNFKGAYDALNYPPNFWGVDTHDFRMRDGLSEEELRSSSVMDYHKRFNSDFSGLGLYDYAALLSGYAGKIEIFDTSSEDFVPKSFITNLNTMDYKDLPYLFSGGNADQIVTNHYKKTKDSYLKGNHSAHMQIKNLGLSPRPENLYKRRLVDIDVLKRKKLESIFVNGASNISEVPYAFCTDGQVRKSDIACQPFIYGSSASEIVDNAIKDYELAHGIKQLGGDFLPSNVSAYLNYAYGRVYSPILRTYQWMYVLSGNENKILPAVHDLAIGAKRGLDFISRVLQTVEPGEYCQDESQNYVPKIDGQDCHNAVVINNFIGKKYGSTFGQDLAGAQESIGYVYDKILALLALIDDHAPINHEFSSWEHQDYSIGFYRVFTPQLTKLFANFYTDQWQNMAPSIIVDQNKEPHIRYQDLFYVINNYKNNGEPKIKPSFSTTLRDFAILFSMAGLSNPLDHKLDFAKRAQISVIAGQVFPHVPENAEEIVFKDPNTGVQYRAFARDGEDLSPGYRLLKNARLFVSEGLDPKEKPGPWYVAKKALHNANIKEEIQAQKNFAETQRILNEKVHVIEQIWKLSKRFAD